MTNHVTNIITYDGDRKQIAEMLEAIKNDELGFGTVDFQKIIPMPDDIYRGNLGRNEKEIYGDKNWYDWCRANWGTKWNAYGYQKGFDYSQTDSLWFQTASIETGKKGETLMKIRVFQIDHTKDEKNLAFRDYQTAITRNGRIDESIYKQVYGGEVPFRTLEEVYALCNGENKPLGYISESMSVSNVIEVTDDSNHCCLSRNP